MKISKQSVQLVDNMGTDLSVVNAARVSFDKEASHYTEEQNSKLISYLANHNHWSPFAHTSISLRIKAPIFLSRQLAKHQVGGSWNEVSRRYVDSEPEFFFPDKWRARAANKKQGSSDEEIDLNKSMACPRSLTLLALKQYELMLQSDVCPEQARMILPQNTMTEWIWTGSVYFFSRVCNLRLDPHAQFEVQEVAKLISDVIRPLYPESWKVLVDDKQKA
jgi:thymidylate synthase (FAD)